MKIQKTDIPDVLLIMPEIYEDDRGFFIETYHKEKFFGLGIPEFVQDNHSSSRKGVLRGLHYQIQHSQGKLVRVVQGTVFDVVVDIRKSSKSFGKWIGQLLSSENKYQLWVPTGFAHGYYVLSESVDFLYKTTDFYSPEYERTILWNDVDLSITWPIPNGETPIISSRDLNGLKFSEADHFD
ncbi:MAG TPA: dTDP-4-dehydrorhamnose 3,5-epimerase [Anaerolineales bacterium]|nr:dTDP-4-dehydrorhamnose 3,5-epimerase [Anaerolineales bacterium]